jgi:hypothetical protein
MNKPIINISSLMLSVLLFISLLILAVLATQNILFPSSTIFAFIIAALFISLIVYAGTV